MSELEFCSDYRMQRKYIRTVYETLFTNAEKNYLSECWRVAHEGQKLGRVLLPGSKFVIFWLNAKASSYY